MLPHSSCSTARRHFNESLHTTTREKLYAVTKTQHRKNKRNNLLKKKRGQYPSVEKRACFALSLSPTHTVSPTHMHTYTSAHTQPELKPGVLDFKLAIPAPLLHRPPVSPIFTAQITSEPTCLWVAGDFSGMHLFIDPQEASSPCPTDEQSTPALQHPRFSVPSLLLITILILMCA